MPSHAPAAYKVIGIQQPSPQPPQGFGRIETTDPGSNVSITRMMSFTDIIDLQQETVSNGGCPMVQTAFHLIEGMTDDTCIGSCCHC